MLPLFASIFPPIFLQYAHYDTLPEIIGRFCWYMKEVGEADQVPARGAAAAQLARL